MILRLFSLFSLFALFALCLAFSRPADACRYKAVPFDELLAAAEKAFVGTVVTVENRLATLSVEKAVGGVSEGETLEVEIGGSSCDIRFEAGQRWLYLGASLPSGSVLLRDANGYDLADNLKPVQEKLGDIAQSDSAIIGGTLERSCAPWDGAAYMITLDNGVTASVYASILDIAVKDRLTPAVFPADGKPERGHGHMLRCPKLKDGETSNIPCQSLTGTITMGEVNAYTASGRLDITDGEHNTRHVFKVKRVEKQVFCG